MRLRWSSAEVYTVSGSVGWGRETTTGTQPPRGVQIGATQHSGCNGITQAVPRDTITSARSPLRSHMTRSFFLPGPHLTSRSGVCLFSFDTSGVQGCCCCCCWAPRLSQPLLLLIPSFSLQNTHTRPGTKLNSD